MKHSLIVVLGPTATGKSDIAVAIAKQCKGEIISADSRQVYRGMDLGTGKITKREMKGVPHSLLDVTSPKSTFSASQFQKKARLAIKKIWQKEKTPILCGGTGFFIDAVVDGIIFPKVPPNAKLRTELNKKSADELFRILKKLDTARAKTIDAKNPHRLIRAIEIAKSLGKVPQMQKNPLDAEILFIGVNKPSSVLKERIHIRLLKRLRGGMLREVQKLRDDGVFWKKLESFGLEYKWCAKYLQKKITKEEMIHGLERDINHFAKRQMTWFKRNKKIHWVENEKEALQITKNSLK
jgi:tRNA dimethylallyltransferase